MTRILFALALILAALPAGAQSPGLSALMATDCSAGESLQRFEAAVTRDSESALVLLRATLTSGLPSDHREGITTAAAARYDRMADWAGRNTHKAHARAFLEQDRAAYVALAYADAELTYRSNALRGLALVGQSQDRALIELTIADDPRLALLGRRALERVIKP